MVAARFIRFVGVMLLLAGVALMFAAYLAEDAGRRRLMCSISDLKRYSRELTHWTAERARVLSDIRDEHSRGVLRWWPIHRPHVRAHLKVKSEQRVNGLRAGLFRLEGRKPVAPE